jgi:hypothetical protein
MIKFYIHNLYSRSLFLKLFACTSDVKLNLSNNIGTVQCTYKGKNIELVFNPELSDETDGYHLIDFLSINYQIFQWDGYSKIDCINKQHGETAHRGGGPFGVNDIPIMKWISDNLVNREGWLVTLMRTEKNFIDSEFIRHAPVTDLEYQIKRLKNHYIFSDNFFINKIAESIHYPNHNFIFTNTIFQWNELLSIRWYYEYSNIFDKINPPYQLCFSMRNHKKNRVILMEELDSLNDSRIYLSRTDNCINADYKHNRSRVSTLNNVHLNNWGTDNWDDISYIQNVEHYLEYMMRILPMAKMHILSESWDYSANNYVSNYLSEKTYGFVLAKIPFISTHTYPYDILREISGVENHPFYNEAVLYKGNQNKFKEFIKEFMENYEVNYKLCKDWVCKVHEIFMEKIYNENSLLDMVITGLDFNKNKKNRNLL